MTPMRMGIEPRIRDRFAALAAIVLIFLVVPVASFAAAMEWDTDRPGQDYRNFPLSDPAPTVCRDACALDPQCAAWTFVKPGVQGPAAVCWLKHSVPAQAASSCCVSGTKTAPGIPPAPAPATGQTFTNPMIWGYRVDWCLELGRACGKPVADEYCRMHGFETSTMHSPARHIGARSPTMAITSGEICGAPECDGFLSITCAGGGTAYSPSPMYSQPGTYAPPAPPISPGYAPPPPPAWPGYLPPAAPYPPGGYAPVPVPKGPAPKGQAVPPPVYKMKPPPKFLKFKPPGPKPHRAPPVKKMQKPPKFLKFKPPGPKPHRAPPVFKMQKPPGK